MYCPKCGTFVAIEQEVPANCSACDTSFTVHKPSRDQLMVQLVRAMRSGQKIEAIKQYRSLFEVGLKDSKDSIEYIMHKLDY